MDTEGNPAGGQFTAVFRSTQERVFGPQRIEGAYTYASVACPGVGLKGGYNSGDETWC